MACMPDYVLPWLLIHIDYIRGWCYASHGMMAQGTMVSSARDQRIQSSQPVIDYLGSEIS